MGPGQPDGDRQWTVCETGNTPCRIADGESLSFKSGSTSMAATVDTRARLERRDGAWFVPPLAPIPLTLTATNRLGRARTPMTERSQSQPPSE